ncbi:acyltransferase [Salmonella enterica subsp. enterica serovar Berlin]|nr:acyltransferase [Salmonella enterica subsp. enterica serovar Berlin]
MKLNHKVDTIQVLRGIAAMMIFFFHNRNYVDAWVPNTSHFLINGISGVDLFFFISGFVLYISYKGEKTLEFAIKRFFRVYIPAAIAILITCLITSTPIIGNVDAYKSLLMIPIKNEGAPYLGYNILIVIWTLTYELYFYLLFTFAVLLTKLTRHLAINICALVISSVVGIQYFSSGSITLNPALYIFEGYSLGIPKQIISVAGNPIILEFIVGVVAGYLFKNIRAHYSLSKRITSWIIFVLSSIFIIRFFGPYYGHGLTGAGLSSLSLFVAFLIWHRGIELGYYSEPNKNLIYLGTISFSVYLMHIIVYKLYENTDPIKTIYNELQPGGALVFSLILTFVISCAFYHIIENNCQKIGRKLSSLSK